MNNMNRSGISLNSKQYAFVLLAIGTLGLISLAAGIKNAWTHSVDFQQPAACLFIAGENPFAYHLDVVRAGNHKGPWSAPNYLHHLYIILAPLCAVDDTIARVVWALFSTGIAVWCVFVLCRMAGRPEYSVLVCFFFFASLPFRNGIGNSQNQMLILACFILSMQARQPASIGVFGAISFVKYSFAGAWLGMALVRDFRAVVWSGLFALAFIIGGAFWISSGDLMVDILGPLIVATKSVSPGHGDFLTILDHILGREYEYRLALAFLILVANISVVAWLVKNSKDQLFQLAVAGVSSLIFLTHLGYDGVFLLPALVFLMAKGGGVSLVGLAAIIYHWQVVKGLHVIGFRSASLEWVVLQAFVYIVILFCVVIVERRDSSQLLTLHSSLTQNQGL